MNKYRVIDSQHLKCTECGEIVEYSPQMIISHSCKPKNICCDPQPDPNTSDEINPAVWDLVIRDMAYRDIICAKKYGTRLKPFNGRNSLIDAYQEALDLAVYLRQLIYEETGK
jgi:hypothetical protein